MKKPEFLVEDVIELLRNFVIEKKRQGYSEWYIGKMIAIILTAIRNKEEL